MQSIHEWRIAIASDVDIFAAREKGRALAQAMGFEKLDTLVIAAAVSELARNILTFAAAGEVRLAVREGPRGVGIMLTACDEGPGIPDLAAALTDGYSTSGGYGIGLPGVRRVMDDFTVCSVPGGGTTVVATKWRPRVLAAASSCAPASIGD